MVWYSEVQLAAVSGCVPATVIAHYKNGGTFLLAWFQWSFLSSDHSMCTRMVGTGTPNSSCGSDTIARSAGENDIQFSFLVMVAIWLDISHWCICEDT